MEHKDVIMITEQEAGAGNFQLQTLNGIIVKELQSEEQGRYSIGREGGGGGGRKTALLLDFNQRMLFANSYTLHLSSHLRSAESVQLQLRPWPLSYPFHAIDARMTQIY